jgi:hypothetical protein
MVATAAPVGGDDVTFDGSVSNVNCNDLGVVPPGGSPGTGGGGTGGVGAPGGTALDSLNLIDGYSGTVTVVAPIQVGTLNLAAGSAGAIAQVNQGAGSDITVTNTFHWTGGTLNSSGTTANVNVYGGGDITPVNSGTVTLGDTLNLYGTDAQPTTLNVNPGTIALAASSGGINVNANANMAVDAFTPNFGTSVNISPTGVTQNPQRVVIAAKGGVTVVGSGVVNGGSTCTCGVPVFNSGKFAVSGVVAVTLSGGNAQAKPAAVYDYTQYTGTLQIENGSRVNATIVGVDIQDGYVQLLTNAKLDQFSQSATLGGNFTFEGGKIIFAPPITIKTVLVYGTFTVIGNVTWTSGTYEPGVDFTTFGTAANNWIIKGTLNIPAENAAFIVDVPQNVPVGVLNPPKGKSWQILSIGTVANMIYPNVNADSQLNTFTLDTTTNPGVWYLDT